MQRFPDWQAVRSRTGTHTECRDRCNEWASPTLFMNVASFRACMGSACVVRDADTAQPTIRRENTSVTNFVRAPLPRCAHRTPAARGDEPGLCRTKCAAGGPRPRTEPDTHPRIGSTRRGTVAFRRRFTGHTRQQARVHPGPVLPPRQNLRTDTRPSRRHSRCLILTQMRAFTRLVDEPRRTVARIIRILPWHDPIPLRRGRNQTQGRSPTIA